MRKLTWFAVSLGVLYVCTVSPARADVAPPNGYVEACTLKKKTTRSSECVECRNSRMNDSKSRCDQLLSPYCYEQVCQTYGASAWTEVWCRTKSENAPVLPESISSQLNGYEAATIEADAGVDGASCADYTPPSTGSDSGCSVSRVTTSSSVAVLGFLGLLGLTLAMKRQQRG